MTSGLYRYPTARPGSLSYALPAVLAFCSWVSLNPYFFWESSRHLIAAGMIAGGCSIIAFWAGGRVRKIEIPGLAILTIFVIYITLLPTTEGGHIKWIYVLPTLMALAVFSDDQRAYVFESFAIIFAISLIPSILASLWCITGLPITMETIPHANPLMAKDSASYLMVPGGLLLASNSTILPWGGALIRICGLYDEPGMVGTIGALLLAGNRFRISSPVFAVILIGGLLSFSLAFAVLMIAGLIFRLLIKRTPKTLLPIAAVSLCGALAAGLVPLGQQEHKASSVKLANGSQLKTLELRQTEHMNNRSLPQMDELIEDFWESDGMSLAFGLGSDASVVRGGVSQVIDRIYTDHGLLGFSLYVYGFLALAIAALVRANDWKWVAPFLMVFALSAYQRPVIWLPYALTIFICGGTYCARRRWHVGENLNANRSSSS